MNQMQPGPPPEPGSEKRILLALVLTFVVIAVMQPLISKYVKQPEQPKQQQTSPEPAATGTPAAQTAVAGGAAQASSGEDHRAGAPGATKKPAGEGARATRASSTKKTAGESPASPEVAPKQATAEQETVVDTDLYRITFT